MNSGLRIFGATVAFFISLPILTSIRSVAEVKPEQALMVYLSKFNMKTRNSSFKLEKGQVYNGFYLRPVQKVQNGYIFEVDNPPSLSDPTIEFSAAYLKSKLEIPEAMLFCGHMVYDGDFQYMAVNGFPQKIPAFHLLSESDPANTDCRVGKWLSEPGKRKKNGK